MVKNRGQRRRDRRRKKQGGGRLTKADKEAQLSESMAKIHDLFIKMEDLFKGCTIAGVAIDSNSGAVCIHVEEHNKVLMFYANDFAIAEHAGKLRDMLLASGFVVPEPIMETWNQEFSDMATAYARAVMAGQEVDREKVDADRIKLILGPYYSPDEAAAELEQIGKSGEEVAEAAAAEDSPEEPEPEQSEAVRNYLRLKTELDEMAEANAGAVSDELDAAVREAWHAIPGEEQEGLRTNEPEPEPEPEEPVEA